MWHLSKRKQGAILISGINRVIRHVQAQQPDRNNVSEARVCVICSAVGPPVEPLCTWLCTLTPRAWTEMQRGVLHQRSHTHERSSVTLKLWKEMLKHRSLRRWVIYLEFHRHLTITWHFGSWDGDAFFSIQIDFQQPIKSSTSHTVMSLFWPILSIIHALFYGFITTPFEPIPLTLKRENWWLIHIFLPNFKLN